MKPWIYGFNKFLNVKIHLTLQSLTILTWISGKSVLRGLALNPSLLLSLTLINSLKSKKVQISRKKSHPLKSPATALSDIPKDQSSIIHHSPWDEMVQGEKSKFSGHKGGP